MEVAKAGSLSAFIEYRQLKSRPVSDEECSTIIRQVLEAIQHIHSMDIMHRDLKLQNVLLRSFQQLEHAVKIADLGLGKKLSAMYSLPESEVCGTVIYMAPEIIFKQAYGKVIPPASSA